MLEVQVKVGERAASTIAAARWRFFSSVRARWKISCATAEITCMTLFVGGCAKFRTVPLRTRFALRSRTCSPRADLEATGMVCSSRPRRAPGGAARLR